MAEFVEVMKQLARLCENCDDCVDCPVFGKGNCGHEMSGNTPNENAAIERSVMAWAAENPEPVYPSWEEGWRQMFPGVEHMPCPSEMFGVKMECEYRYMTYLDCDACKRRPMDADVARKLGIRPVKGRGM